MASRVPAVKGVFVRDDGGCLDVITVYAGRMDDVKDALYAAEAEVFLQYPSARADFRLLSADQASWYELRESARQALSRSSPMPAADEHLAQAAHNERLSLAVRAEFPD